MTYQNYRLAGHYRQGQGVREGYFHTAEAQVSGAPLDTAELQVSGATLDTAELQVSGAPLDTAELQVSGAYP